MVRGLNSVYVDHLDLGIIVEFNGMMYCTMCNVYSNKHSSPQNLSDLFCLFKILTVTYE